MKGVEGHNGGQLQLVELPPGEREQRRQGVVVNRPRATAHEVEDELAEPVDRLVGDVTRPDIFGDF